MIKKLLIPIILLLFGSCAHKINKPNLSSFGSSSVSYFEDNKSLFISYVEKKPSKLPAIIFIQGSGCDSNFAKKNEKVYSTGLYGLGLSFFKGKAHIFAVDKPNVPLFYSVKGAGQTEQCSERFRQSFTLTEWTQHLKDKITYISDLSFVDRNRIILIGHSEGGEVASYLSAIDKRVTDVIALSFGGTGQLFDFINLTHKSATSSKINTSDEVKKILSKYDEIIANPNSYNDFAWGHTFKYWSDKFGKRSYKSLMKTHARIFIAQGTKDQATPIEAFDFLISYLKTNGKKFDYERVEGAKHDYSTDKLNASQGFVSLFKRIDNWLNIN